MKRTILAAAAVFALSAGVTFAATAPHWVGTWGAPPAVSSPTSPAFENQTIRQIMRISAGGTHVRVRISNEYGTTPLVIGSATIAKAGEGAALGGPAKGITFGGKASISIPAGAPVLSDPIDFPVAALSSVAISLFVPEKTGPCTCHPQGTATTWLSPPGDFTDKAFTPVPYVAPGRAGGAAGAPPAAAGAAPGAGAGRGGSAPAAGGAGRGPAVLTQRAFVTAIEVDTRPSGKTIITFGDSITDGTRSTNDKNARWHDYFAERLVARNKNQAWGVVNEAISGNQVLRLGTPNFGDPALKRFDRDVLSNPNVAYMTVLEGINDLGMNRPNIPSADLIIQGYRQLIARAHAHGIKVIFATLLPFEGAAYYSEAGDVERGKVNVWIRTSGEPDGVIDFDVTMRDPANPKKLRADLQSGDWLHPNDAGYKVMADSIDLRLFR